MEVFSSCNELKKLKVDVHWESLQFGFDPTLIYVIFLNFSEISIDNVALEYQKRRSAASLEFNSEN